MITMNDLPWFYTKNLVDVNLNVYHNGKIVDQTNVKFGEGSIHG